MSLVSSNTAELIGASVPDVSTSRGRPLTSRWSRRIVMDVVGFIEALAVVAGGLVPAVIYAYGGGLPVDWAKHLQVCLITALIVYGALRNFGMYDVEQIHDLPTTPSRLMLALGIAFVAIFGIGVPFAPRDMHVWIWYATWLSMSFVLLLDVRFAARYVLRRMTKAGAFDAAVAVYGSGGIAVRVQNYLANPALAVRFAGVYDDRRDASRIAGDGPVIAGGLEELKLAACSGQVDRIIIALPQAADQRVQHIARSLERLPVSLHVVTHIESDLIDSGRAHKVSSIGPVGLIDVKDKPLADWSRLLKAVEDRLLASLLIVITLPLLALIALLIRLDSSGPVLFRQRRRGLNSRVFEVLKFRTMHVLEDNHDVRQATRDDPRVTRIGRFLRRYSLDELPQLFNVVRGEMSLVGPRPHALAHDEKFGEMMLRYANRQQVKPGITGLAQVSGYRGEVETREQLEQRLGKDLEYVDNWSLWLDLRILARTIIFGWTGKKAY